MLHVVVAVALSLAALILAVIFLRSYCDQSPSWSKTVVKTASTGILAFVSLIMVGPVALTMALALGAVGDFMLARGGARSFLIGLISFALAHLAYAVLMVSIGQGLGPWMAYVVLVVFGGVMARVLFAKTAELRWPVMAYIVIIIMVGAAAFGTGRPVLIAAAMLFIVSDAILSAELFVLPDGAHLRKFTPYAVWSTYWAAQALFLYGFIAV